MNKNIVLFAILVGCATARAQSGTAVRELPFDFHPGDLVEVRIQVVPPVGTTNWSVLESYPDRWDFVSTTNASSTNEFNGELFFGPFTNSSPRTLSYAVASIAGITNAVNFAGLVEFNGSANPVVGTIFLPARNEWLFAGPQVLDSQVGISGIAYGAGRWLASSFGWVTTIESGGRLTYPRGPLGTRFYGDGGSRLAYVGSLFLLFGASPDNPARMTVSDDGLSWKAAINEPGDPHPDPFAGPGFIRSAAYGNGVYVAVGEHFYSGEQFNQGAVFRSTNGYNWRRIYRLPVTSTNPSPRIIHAVTFADNRFLAVADRGTLLTSTNGSDWSAIQPITNPGSTNSVWLNRHLQGICHGPAGWIISTSVAGTVLRSVDGEAWTELTGTGSGSSLYWQSFYADGKYWFSGYGDSYSTSNGTSWTRLPSQSLSHPSGPVSRAPDGVNPQYLGAGLNSGSLVASSNGIAWSNAVPSNVAVRWPRYLSVTSFSNEWVVTGQYAAPTAGSGRQTPNDRFPYVWVPNLTGSVLSIRNGNDHWRAGPGSAVAYGDLLPSTNGLLAAGANNNKLQVDLLAGPNYSAAASTILPDSIRSVPAQYWKYTGPNFIGGAFFNAYFAKAALGHDLFIERYSYTENNTIRWGHFTSASGSNWVRRAAGLNNATNFPGVRGIAWGAGRFVAVSEGSSPGTFATLTTTNRIFTSQDGENYSPVALSGLTAPLSGEGLTGVAFADGKFVAIGNSGRILYSTNGMDWVTARPSDGRRWNRIRHLGKVWGVVGNAGWLAFSLDGENWHSRTAGAESDLTDIAYLNGQFMLVGSHAMVLLSQPVTPAQIVTTSITKLPGAGLQFSVTGQPGRVLDIQTSSNLTHWTSLLIRSNSTGTTEINDSTPSAEHRFYRAVQQP